MQEKCCGPDGVFPCPNGTNVLTSLCNGDMMLCKDCKRSRFNPVTTHNADETNMKTPLSDKILVDELLCFITNKIDFLNADVIIQICVQNYDDAVIEQSKRRLYTSCNAESKCKGHRGNGKARKNIEDIIAFLIERNGDTPTFVAKDLNKLPPITFDDVDLTSLLNSIAKTKA